MLSTSRPPRRLRRLVLPATLVAGLAAAVVSTVGVSAAAVDPLAGAATAVRAAAVSPAASSKAPLATLEDDSDADRTQPAIDDARAAVAEAASVTGDVAASGLAVNAPSTAVDTGELTAQIDALATGPDVFVPTLTQDLADQVTQVRVEVSALRGALDAAVAQKAADDAAAEAQREAEQAAAAAAASSSSSSSASSSSGSASAPAVGYVDPGSAQAIARDMIAGYGWGDDQFSCLVALWNRESGWNVSASSSSGAYGIPQALPGSKMASAGADWRTNPATQISWGLGYITGRYGDACTAWGHSQSTGWY